MKFNILLISWLFLHPALSCADLLMDMEGGDFSGVKKLSENSEGETREYYRGLEQLYRGNYAGAREIFLNVSTASLAQNGWLKSYVENVAPIVGEMGSRESEHFILYAKPRDLILAPYALETLEKTYLEIGKDLGVFPEAKVRVEIHASADDFSAASTLSREILERSGAIGICKFRKLMVLSPAELAYGYRWLDTLSHEYVHYCINILSHGKCPLWLHEGIAKFLETRWRADPPVYLTPGNRTELVQALNEDKLISFRRMEPSMVYLENQTEVQLAFSEVAHAVHTIENLKKRAGISAILASMGTGKSRDEAFQEVLGLSSDQFESKWREFLKNEGLKESPGAAIDILKIGKAADEVEEWSGVGARDHIRLGDRFRMAGKNDVALVQYKRALALEPANPVALVKSARTLLALGNPKDAVKNLEKSAQENPNYAPAFLILGEQMIAGGSTDQARLYYEEANALNPFNPEIHIALAKIYDLEGNKEKSQREIEVYKILAGVNEEK